MPPRGRPENSNGTTPSDNSMTDHNERLNGPKKGVEEDSMMVDIYYPPLPCRQLSHTSGEAQNVFEENIFADYGIFGHLGYSRLYSKIPEHPRFSS